MTYAAIQSTRQHGGNPWAAGRAPHDVLDFSVDINPLGAPPAVRDAILQHLDDIHVYPDPHAAELCAAVAVHHGVGTDHIVVGNGSAELIALLPRLMPTPRALIMAPTFSEYAWAVEQAGGSVEYVELKEADGFCAAWDAGWWRARLARADIVFLCNPNNPTGLLVGADDVRRLAQWCRESSTWLVVDEAFMDLVDAPQTLVGDVAPGDQLVVLRSLTKSFAIPGLRLGYAVAPPLLTERLRAAQPAWPVNALALAVGLRLLQERDFLARTRQALRPLRAQLSDAIAALGWLRPLPSTTGFLLCQLTDTSLTSTELTDRLAARGVLIRNCDSFVGLESGRFVRVAVRAPEDNARLVRALQDVRHGR